MSKSAEYYLFRVDTDNGFQGRSFILKDDEGLETFGLNPCTVKQAVNKAVVVFGMRVWRIEEDEIHFEDRRDYSDIQHLFQTNKLYFHTKFHPVIGTVVEPGEYEGYQFSFFVSTEFIGYFDYNNIRFVINGYIEKHYGCVFKTVTPREAIAVHGKFTHELGCYLNEHYRRVTKKVEPEGQ